MSDEERGRFDEFPVAGSKGSEDAGFGQQPQGETDSPVEDSRSDRGSGGLVEATATRNPDFLSKIRMELSVEIGRTVILIKNFLELGQGSILELDKPAGDSLDVLINGKVVARGEVVVQGDMFSVRLTEIVDPPSGSNILD